jgi:hypothetical protein
MFIEKCIYIYNINYTPYINIHRGESNVIYLVP